ncbi:nuclear transport factor 2 family protein [Oligoflexus tunisiensis]|uniref:nuclear transport factor 2 family protein n=1 Tax=Oligoflexus tunisiensis TaxID=708132 RepID=UPI00114D0630|nr:nuclear transport factor 2 family protein [Oligoflexus tunisiensis]
MKTMLGLFGTLAFSACVSTSSKNSNSELIDKQYAAYNSKDIDRFMSFFASSAKICTVPADICMEGESQIRAHFSEFFSKFETLDAKVSKRIIDQDYVLDWEQLSAVAKNGKAVKLSGISVYRVERGKIASLTIFLNHKE